MSISEMNTIFSGMLRFAKNLNCSEMFIMLLWWFTTIQLSGSLWLLDIYGINMRMVTDLN